MDRLPSVVRKLPSENSTCPGSTSQTLAARSIICAFTSWAAS